MATMEYDGFIASIDYNSDLDSFMGNVINVSSPITFYGKTTDELKREFAKSVVIWRSVCKERGIEAEKPSSGRSWSALYDAIEQFSPDFMDHRKQPPVQSRYD